MVGYKSGQVVDGGESFEIIQQLPNLRLVFSSIVFLWQKYDTPFVLSNTSRSLRPQPHSHRVLTPQQQ